MNKTEKEPAQVLYYYKKDNRGEELPRQCNLLVSTEKFSIVLDLDTNKELALPNEDYRVLPYLECAPYMYVYSFITAHTTTDYKVEMTKRQANALAYFVKQHSSMESTKNQPQEK